MAKNRNKKKKLKNGSAPMDLTSDEQVFHVPQAMDTSEPGASRTSIGGPHRKTKGVQMKRTKNVRKMKAIDKAISKNEQSEQKISKNESKITRIQSAKKLYD
ncbi:uncharacterized protein [Coffea arabica]|uniref:Uncharacterized protein n=1 Tax=Coffea arabica TaxID=13443 RepID=A0A6P6XMN0_COFAR|nr:uncharacterized protein LOC113743482 [Coffea arabica]